MAEVKITIKTSLFNPYTKSTFTSRSSAVIDSVGIFLTFAQMLIK